MKASAIYFNNLASLRNHLLSHQKTLFVSSLTSTVIPYETVGGFLDNHHLFLGHLSTMPKSMQLLENDHLKVSGGITWQEALQYLRSEGRDLMAWPTEESACVLAGLATSATGERSFGFGPIRDHVLKIVYMDYKGDLNSLDRSRSLINHPIFKDKQLILNYQKFFKSYGQMKNGPFPRLEYETDLMVGFEGQTGVIIEGIFKTIPWKQTRIMVCPLPKWEEDFSSHLEIFKKIQKFRGKIYSAEFFDSNCLKILPQSPLNQANDFLALEVLEEFLDEVFKDLWPEGIFEMPSNRFHDIRRGIPRVINEINSRRGVIKKGTDVQMSELRDLFVLYKEFALQSIPYNLIGHFGDAHLHFNFLPQKEELIKVEEILDKFYGQISGSPFAEHGIGIIKKRYIRRFLNEDVLKIYKVIKESMDPFDQFFPLGYLNLYREIK